MTMTIPTSRHPDIPTFRHPDIPTFRLGAESGEWFPYSWFPTSLSFFSLRSELSPCYLNRMDVTEVSVGWGRYTLEILRDVVTWLFPLASNGPFEIIKCLAPPVQEYRFPVDLEG